MTFKHLSDVNQTYTQHMKDSMKYSWSSLKSAFYFFCHGLLPCVYEHEGSDNVSRLHVKITDKYEQIQSDQLGLNLKP